MKKFWVAALAVFSAAVPARAQTAETPDVTERDLPAIISAVSLDEAMTMGLLDDEDGTLVYEVEFKFGGMEYSYEINAATGAILKHEAEIDD